MLREEPGPESWDGGLESGHLNFRGKSLPLCGAERQREASVLSQTLPTGRMDLMAT